MNATTHSDENPSATDAGPLYGYIILGQDTIGNVHIYRAKDETVLILDSGGRPVARQDLAGRPLHHYEAFVEDRRGWYDYDPRIPTEDDWTSWALREG